jgi:hypothetical protein
MEDIRRALVDAGVPSRCLPPVSRTEKAMGAVAEAARESAHHPKQALLRVYLIALGYHWWPKDPLLTRLAAEVEVSRRTAYDAKGAGPLRPQGAQPASGKPPVPPVPITPETVLSSAAGQAAFNGQAQCDPSHSVRPTALAEVQPTALSAGHQSGGTAS